MSMRGQGVPHDDLEAVDWFRKAAEQGDGTGEAWLGFSYFIGFGGVPEDRAEAMKWYRKAAKQGNAVGERGLGETFMYGIVVSHDDDQAAMWFRKAAEQGDAVAQHDLGGAYEYGRGVPKDFVLAYMWESLASTSEFNVGLLARSARDGLAKQMNPEQIAEAQRMAGRVEANEIARPRSRGRNARMPLDHASPVGTPKNESRQIDAAVCLDHLEN
jgi:uncharacterized protein